MSLHEFFAQVATNAADATPVNPVDAAAQARSGWSSLLMFPLIVLMFYFAFFRPQIQAKKKQEEVLKGTKTGDKVVTTSGIHGVVTNVKDTTVIVKVADNVKLEIEKSHIDKVIRPDTADSDKPAATKA